MKMLKLAMAVLLALLALFPAVWAADTKDSLEVADNVTVITAVRLTFDYKNKYALFEENVVVSDPEMQLTSDKLIVHFAEEGKVTSIKAEGHVNMKQDDKVGQCALATYDVPSGKIVMAGKPRVSRGRDVLEGDIITFWRDDNKMVVQPQARLVIYPDGRENSKDLFLGGE